MKDSKAFLDAILSGKNIDDNIKVLVIAPHPDDEILGLGCLMSRIKNLSLLHTTDGSPDNYIYHNKNAFLSGEAYSKLRFNELSNALNILRVNLQHHIKLGMKDQSLSFNIPMLTKNIFKCILKILPDYIFLCPFEGGHPDHDSTALAVHNAVKIINEEGFDIKLIEYALYFNSNGLMITGEFLPYPEDVSILLLNENEKELKQRLFDCFISQKETIDCFQMEHEKFRIAPAYNFLKKPHPGRMYYDLFNWGINSDDWLKKADEAIKEIKYFRLKEMKELYEYS